MDIRKIANAGLMNFFFESKEMTKEELKKEREDILTDIDNINDVVNMWSNNGWGWIDEGTHAHAMDMCEEATRGLPKLEIKLKIVEYFL